MSIMDAAALLEAPAPMLPRVPPPLPVGHITRKGAHPPPPLILAAMSPIRPPPVGGGRSARHVRGRSLLAGSGEDRYTPVAPAYLFPSLTSRPLLSRGADASPETSRSQTTAASPLALARLLGDYVPPRLLGAHVPGHVLRAEDAAAAAAAARGPWRRQRAGGAGEAAASPPRRRAAAAASAPLLVYRRRGGKGGVALELERARRVRAAALQQLAASQRAAAAEAEGFDGSSYVDLRGHGDVGPPLAVTARERAALRELRRAAASDGTLDGISAAGGVDSIAALQASFHSLLPSPVKPRSVWPGPPPGATAVGMQRQAGGEQTRVARAQWSRRVLRPSVRRAGGSSSETSSGGGGTNPEPFARQLAPPHALDASGALHMSVVTFVPNMSVSAGPGASASLGTFDDSRFGSCGEGEGESLAADADVAVGSRRGAPVWWLNSGASLPISAQRGPTKVVTSFVLPVAIGARAGRSLPGVGSAAARFGYVPDLQARRRRRGRRRARELWAILRRHVVRPELGVIKRWQELVRRRKEAGDAVVRGGIVTDIEKGGEAIPARMQGDLALYSNVRLGARWWRWRWRCDPRPHSPRAACRRRWRRARRTSTTRS